MQGSTLAKLNWFPWDLGSCDYKVLLTCKPMHAHNHKCEFFSAAEFTFNMWANEVANTIKAMLRGGKEIIQIACVLCSECLRYWLLGQDYNHSSLQNLPSLALNTTSNQSFTLPKIMSSLLQDSVIAIVILTNDAAGFMGCSLFWMLPNFPSCS